MQTNRMDKYAVTLQPANATELRPESTAVQEPSLGVIMAAIQDLKQALEPKIHVVTVYVNLLQVDFQKMSEKIKTAETNNHTLQATTKRMEDQVQHRTKQNAIMAGKLEDQEGSALRNDIRVVGVPEGTEGAEGPSVDLFVEDLVLNTIRPKRISKFFSIERAHRVPIPHQIQESPLQNHQCQDFQLQGTILQGLQTKAKDALTCKTQSDFRWQVMELYHTGRGLGVD
ncbi:hypothetical protein NDU88_003444 [Pleurodeles waltl]|uniref:Uncharacterized protein n=1 Tax=Pleurodeles waltl TaxID=8319 RepID=A0AAV7WT30_PLEWA|nr:hypothetical protein NDU88_003444 [Pleurodeles waltl]